MQIRIGPHHAYGSTVPREETLPTDSNEHPVTASISGLEPNGRHLPLPGAGVTVNR